MLMHRVCAGDLESLRTKNKDLLCELKRCIDVWSNEFVQYGVEMQKVGNMCVGTYLQYVTRARKT